MSNRDEPLHPPSEEEQTLKPDILEEGDRGPLSPSEALKRDRETYGDDSTFPNRDDIEDEHSGSS